MLERSRRVAHQRQGASQPLAARRPSGSDLPGAGNSEIITGRCGCRVDLRDDAQSAYLSRGRIRHARLDSIHGLGRHPGRRLPRLPDDPLYRNLDRLHHHRATIESALAEREQSLFNLGNTVLLYDLTSTYFEGKADLIPKAKRGYSRDHRPDCKQLVVGLVIGREGFPRAHEIFEGNTQDRQTLATMLDLLEQRVGFLTAQRSSSTAGWPSRRTSRNYAGETCITS